MGKQIEGNAQTEHGQETKLDHENRDGEGEQERRPDQETW